MNVSAVSGSPSAHYAANLQAALAAKAQSAAAAPMDSDGDHDGSTAPTGRLDVKA